LISIIQLDFGVSFASGKSVISEIKNRIGVTLAINLISMVAVFAISLKLGVDVQ